MKKMMLGIFLMLLSLWCLTFGTADHFAPLIYVSLALLVVSIFIFWVGYDGFDKK